MSTRLTDQAGFTLVELLVAMVIAVIVLGGGTYGLAMAFNQSTEVTARTASTNAAETGLQQLTHDLRYATNCPTYSGTNTLGSGGTYLSGLTVSTGPTLQMCDPIAGAHSSEPPAIELVTWTCNTGSAIEKCTRSWVPVLCTSGSTTSAATGNCSAGAVSASGTVSGSSTIYGVTSITFSGIVANASQASLLSDSACLLSGGAMGYTLTASAPCTLSWVSVRVRIMPLIDPGSANDSANTVLDSKLSPVQIQTGAAMRNFYG